jgi:methyl-accepting chemotaxis protein
MGHTIRQKLILGFSVVFVLMLVAAGFSYYKLSQLAAAQHTVTNLRLKVVNATWDLRSINNRLSTDLSNYILLAGDPAQTAAIRKDWGSTWNRVDNSTTILKEVSGKLTAADQERIAHLAAAIPEYRRSQEAVLAVIDTRGADGIREALQLLQAQANPKTLEIRALATALGVSAGDLMKLSVQEMDAARESTIWALILSTIATILTGSMLVFLSTRTMVAGLAAAVKRADEIATGDLCVSPLVSRSKDEIAGLSAALNQMQASLGQILRSIGQNAASIASASEEISAAATQNSEGSQRQHEQTDQVATAIQEMSSTVREVSDNSTRAATAAQQAAQSAQHGGKVVETALATMRSLVETVGTTANQVQELGNSSGRIGHVAAVIDEIAEQTNLLALNAAIEAARAGEQGRGFAVVADEVRKLAERTTKATKEIAEMITAVQSETKSAVVNMQTGMKQAEAGVRIADQAGHSLAEIVQSAQQVGDMVAQIATAAQQQSSATEQIRHSMESIAQITRESAMSAEQSANASQDLANLALDLRQVVSHFKLENTGNPERSNAGRAPRTKTTHSRNQSSLPPAIGADKRNHAASGFHNPLAGDRT